MKEGSKIKLPFTEEAIVWFCYYLSMLVFYAVGMYTPLLAYIDEHVEKPGWVMILMILGLILYIVLTFLIRFTLFWPFQLMPDKEWPLVIKRKIRIPRWSVRLFVVALNFIFVAPFVLLKKWYQRQPEDFSQLQVDLFVIVMGALLFTVIYLYNKLKAWFDSKYDLIGFFPKNKWPKVGVEIVEDGFTIKGDYYKWNELQMVTAEADKGRERGILTVKFFFNGGRSFSISYNTAEYCDLVEALVVKFQLVKFYMNLNYLFTEEQASAMVMWTRDGSETDLSVE